MSLPWRSNRKNIVVLRQTALSKAALFIRRYGIIIFPVFAVIIIMAGRGLVKANTAIYYPSSCLGDWEGVQNALGAPELPLGSDKFLFHEHNSAKFSSGTAKMFCGNFSGEDLRGAPFRRAILSLSWSLVYEYEYAAAQAVPETVVSEESEASTTVSSSEPIADSSSTVTTSSPETPPSTTSTASTTEPTPLAEPLSIDETMETEKTPPSATVETPKETSSTVEQPAAVPDSQEETSTREVLATPAFGNITISPPEVGEGEQAGEALTSSPASSTLGSGGGPRFLTPLTLDELSRQLVSSSDSSSIPTSGAATEETLAIPFDVGEESLQSGENPVPTSPNYVEVSYSMDGENWHLLTLMQAHQWNNQQFDLPLKSYEDLQDVQIRVSASSDGSNPFLVFLDGMSVQVEADPVSAEWLNRMLPKPDATPPPVAPARNQKPIYSPEAKHTCSIEPFSIAMPPSGSSTLRLQLNPADSSKTYTTRTGELPVGVDAVFATGSTSTEMLLRLVAGPEAQTGSLNSAVIYEERQEDGSVIPNFCQFNLIIE